MVKRVLVMGAAGALGYSVVREASSAGHGVRAMLRRPRPEFFDGLDVEVVRGDAERPGDVERAAEGCDAVAYCINVPLRSWHEKLVPLLDNAIAACAATGARLVFPGNVWIYGPGRPGETVDESPPASPTSRKGRCSTGPSTAPGSGGSLRLPTRRASVPRSSGSARTRARGIRIEADLRGWLPLPRRELRAGIGASTASR